MAFTNIYDNSFPPDTQLANLLGLDLRNVRLDMQERMSAISGLDAMKPAFGADTQPTKWNGVLFFATDTGKIYQFNNPAWTDVTSNFTAKSAALKAVNQVTHVGTTTLDTIYTLNIPANIIGATGRVRMTLTFGLNQITNLDTMQVNFGATVIGTANNILSSFGTIPLIKLVIDGGNTGATNAQFWDGGLLYIPSGSTTQEVRNFNISGAGITGAVDTTAGVVVTVKLQNGTVSDSQTFNMFTVEFF